MSTGDMNCYPEIERELLDTIAQVRLEPHLIDTKVSELEARLGSGVYAQLLYLLCHLDFPPDEARSHWRRVLEHHVRLGKKIGQPIDFRVAILDYFTSVNQHIENPKIIEIQIYMKTRDYAIRDELTSLYNYRYFSYQLDREVNRAQRLGGPLSLVIFDVDYFKWYNDWNGHLSGDKALKTVAEIMTREVRDSDLVTRYGGEEFAILLPDAGKTEAFQVADRIRAKVREHPFQYAEQQPNGRLTVSAGLATFRADAEDQLSLVEAADMALYFAKGNGKDQVVTAGDEKRNWPRLELQLSGQVQCLSPEKHPFTTDNVSEQGLQLRLTAPMQVGELFSFTLTLPERNREVAGVGKSLWVKEQADDHVVGAKIIEMSSDQVKILRDYFEVMRAMNPDRVVVNESDVEET